MQTKVITLGLVLLSCCGLIIAKKESENNNNTNLEKQIFTEGGIGISSHPESSSDGESSKERKSRVKSRKGVSFEEFKNETSSDPAQSSKLSSNSTSSAPSLPVTVQKSNSSSSNSSESAKSSSNSTSIVKITSGSNNNNNNSTEKPSTTSTTTTTNKPSTTTTTKTTTTQLPIRKPTITLSADDSPLIQEDEKKINYNVAKEKSPEDVPPKLEQDVDRTVLEEKRAQRSYMIYLGLAVCLPLAFFCGNLAYKRVKNYLELRHYTRVDFLVDGMYVN